MHMTFENYEPLFHNLLRWARYGNLFSYDETGETLSVPA